jgi:hypothetical protein
MELAALALWIVVALIGVPLATAAALGPGTLLVQGICAVGGLVLYALYVILDGGDTFLWIGFGLAVLGVLSLLPGIAWLVSEDRAAGGAPAQPFEELAASLAGLQVYLLGAAGLLSLGAALGLTAIS